MEEGYEYWETNTLKYKNSNAKMEYTLDIGHNCRIMCNKNEVSRTMRNKNKLTAILYFVSSILFFISALIGKNYVFIPIGCCFVVLGIKYNNKKVNDKGDKYL